MDVEFRPPPTPVAGSGPTKLLNVFRLSLHVWPSGFISQFLIALIASAATSSVGHFAVSESQKHQVRSVIVEATA